MGRHPHLQSRAGFTRALTALAAAFLFCAGGFAVLDPDSHTTVSAWEEYPLEEDAGATFYGIPGGQGSGDKMGSSLAFGDIDNDGYDDLIVGAPQADGNGDNWIDCGEVYLFWGGPRGVIGDIRNASSEANVTVRVSDKSVGMGGECGYVVASGDVNGDGYDDMVLGEPLYANRGRTYIIFGGARGTLDGRTLDMTSGDWDVKVQGLQQGDQSGSGLAVGDIDGDGFDDVVIGAESYMYGSSPGNNNAGRCWLLFGSMGIGGNINPSTLPVIVNSMPTGSGDYLGHSIAIGDFDNDTKGDIAISTYKSGSTGNARPNGGQVHLFWGQSQGFFSGRTWNLGTTPANVTFNGTANAYFGTSLAFGDVDGDGWDDLMAGATGGPGGAHVFFGANRTEWPRYRDLALDPADITLFGQDDDDWAGASVAAGDLNDDGLDDIIVGAPKADGLADDSSNVGEAYVVFGGARDDLGGEKVLGAHVIYGGKDMDDDAGTAVASGDMDGDGVDDLAVGAPLGDGIADDGNNHGEAYLVYGASRSTTISPGIRYQGENGTFYAEYREYHLAFNISNPNPGGADRLTAVNLVIDPGGEAVTLRWTKAFTFEEVSDPDDLVTVVAGSSAAELTTAESYYVDFGVRFGWAFDLSGPVDIYAAASGSGGFSPAASFEDVFTVDNDLVLNGTLRAEAEHQGNITEGDFVRGGENITFSGLALYYFGSPEYVPPGSAGLKVVAEDDGGNQYDAIHDPLSGNVTIQAVSDPETDLDEDFQFTVKDLPHPSVADHSDVSFGLRVDATPPSAPTEVTCWADAPDDDMRPWSSYADDDMQIYVTWEDAVEGAGESGLAHHAMAFDDEHPTAPNSSGDTAVADGPGTAVFYVRAVDNVGNWGPANSSSMIIDKESLAFTSLGPDAGSWHNSTTMNVTAIVADLYSVEGHGSGVDPSAIHYRVSYDGDDPLNYGEWIDAGSDAEPVEEVEAWAIVTGLEEGAGNYVQWKAVDAAWNTAVLSDPLNILVDVTDPVFSSPSPNPSRWNGDTTLDLAITITDGLSGADASSVKYQYSTDGGSNWTAWEAATAAGGGGRAPWVRATAQVTVKEGRANLVRWSASDLAGNRVVSVPYSLKVDDTPVAFADFTPAEGEVQPDMEVTVSININDAASGVNASTVAYRYATHGASATDWSGWIPVEYVGKAYPDFMVVQRTLVFATGDLNRVQFRAQDGAGTGMVESAFYEVIVNTPPIVNLSSPLEGSVYNETLDITFDGGSSFDGDGDELVFNWESSIDGYLGDEASFTARLTRGEHTITLYVEDGHGGTAWATVTVNVLPAGVDPGGKEPPGDGEDGDDGTGEGTDQKGLLSGTSLLIIVGVVVMIIILVLFAVMFKKIKYELSKDRVTAELVTDTIGLPGEAPLQLPAPTARKAGAGGGGEDETPAPPVVDPESTLPAPKDTVVEKPGADDAPRVGTTPEDEGVGGAEEGEDAGPDDGAGGPGELPPEDAGGEDVELPPEEDAGEEMPSGDEGEDELVEEGGGGGGEELPPEEEAEDGGGLPPEEEGADGEGPSEEEEEGEEATEPDDDLDGIMDELDLDL